jgi:hypothetical protein
MLAMATAPRVVVIILPPPRLMAMWPAPPPIRELHSMMAPRGATKSRARCIESGALSQTWWRRALRRGWCQRGDGGQPVAFDGINEDIFGRRLPYPVENKAGDRDYSHLSLGGLPDRWLPFTLGF